mmetsp:Transcript_23334/g.81326  ORF Transcript_23334/g.81326 Transcript_23334/m.81326 type:complete len:845 (-) Transcript_23334:2603-5137(-)
MSDDELWDDDDAPATPEEIKAAAQRSLRIVNMIIFCIGAMVCGWAYKSGLDSFNGAWVAYVVAGIGCATVFVSCLGCCGVTAKHTQMLLLYYSLLVLASFALFMAGGFCFILTNQAVLFVRKNWAQLSTASESDAAAAEDKVATNLRVSGAFSFFLCALLCCAMSNTVKLVEGVRAYTILLQSTNIALMPFGILLISSAAFIADTAASVDAPATAFAIFVLGVFVICISFVGCFGTSISSRGLLKLSMYLLAFLAVCFFIFGAVAFSQSSRLKDELSARWTTIRRVLPPTFSGKYDQERFEAFLEGNLNAMGYASLCMSAFLTVMVWGCVKLRKALKDDSDESMWDGPALPDASFSGHDPTLSAQRAWKRAWSHGTVASRRLIKCGCVCLCCGVLLIVVISSMALYFSTSCFSLSSFKENFEYDVTAGAEEGDPPVLDIAIYNNYTRGMTQVAVDADLESAIIDFEKSAFQEGFQSTAEVEAVRTSVDETRDRITLQLDPGPKTKVLTYDISCQMAVVTVNVPPASVAGDTMEESRDGYRVYFNTISPYAGVELSPGESAPRFKRVVASTTIGSVTFDGAKIGANGARAQSTNGEVVIANSDVHCDPVNLGTTRGQVALKTSLGSVIVQDTTFLDCELHGQGEASLVQVSNVVSENSLGTGALVRLSGIKGLVEAKDSESDNFNLRSQEGSVRATNVVVRENLKAASQSGTVVVDGAKIALGGSVQVETTSGNINIDLSEFSGFISIHTSGVATLAGCANGVCPPHFADMVIVTPTAEELEDEEAAHVSSITGTVNCASEGLCAYRGELIVTSSTGGVTVNVDAWSTTAQAGGDEEAGSGARHL